MNVQGPVVPVSAAGVTNDVPIETTVDVVDFTDDYNVEVSGPTKLPLGAEVTYDYKVYKKDSEATECHNRSVTCGEFPWTAKPSGKNIKAQGPKVSVSSKGLDGSVVPTKKVTVVSLKSIDQSVSEDPDEGVTLSSRTRPEHYADRTFWTLRGSKVTGPSSSVSYTPSGEGSPVDVTAYLKLNGHKGNEHSFSMANYSGPYSVKVIGPDAIEKGTKAGYVYKIIKKGKGVIDAGEASFTGNKTGSALRIIDRGVSFTDGDEDKTIDIKKNIDVVAFDGFQGPAAVPAGERATVRGKTKPTGYEDSIGWFFNGHQAYGATELTRWFPQGSHDVTVRVSLNDKVWSEPTSATIDAVVVSDISPVRVPVGEKVTFSATTSPSGHGALVNWDSKERTANYNTTYKTEGTYTLQTAIKAGGATGPPERFEVEALPLKDPKNLDPSGKLEEFLKDEEKLRTDHYDSDGGGHCTIGYGHLIHLGECGSKPKNPEWQKYKDGLPGKEKKEKKEAAENLFQNDLEERGAKWVEKLVDVKLTQYQYDALTSIMFNSDPADFVGSKLEKAIENKSSTKKIQQLIENYKVSASGHTPRRKQEAALFGGESL